MSHDDSPNQDSLGTEKEQKSQQVSSKDSTASPNETASRIKDEDKAKENQRDNKELPVSPPSSAANPSMRHLKQFRDYYNGELTRIERLMVKRVEERIHASYYKSWVAEANRFYKLTVNLNTRLNEQVKDKPAKKAS